MLPHLRGLSSQALLWDRLPLLYLHTPRTGFISISTCGVPCPETLISFGWRSLCGFLSSASFQRGSLFPQIRGSGLGIAPRLWTSVAATIQAPGPLWARDPKKYCVYARAFYTSQPPLRFACGLWSGTIGLTPNHHRHKSGENVKYLNIADTWR